MIVTFDVETSTKCKGNPFTHPSDLFEYKDGSLFWKVSPSDFVKVGQRAGRQGTRGYWQVKINGKMYSLHHLIWWIFHGYKPCYIDHIDGDTNNNRIENLRECSLSNNQFNSKIRVTNSSGYKNVVLDKRTGKWMVRITCHGIRHHYSPFDTAEEASMYAMEMRNKLHKEFARHT